MSLGKWEVEGEIYLQENGYDEYDIVEPYIITTHMNRGNIIYKDRDMIYGLYQCMRERLADTGLLVERGLHLSNWLEYVVGLKPAREYCHSTNLDYNYTINFQPQTKKVRITIEEIE